MIVILIAITYPETLVIILTINSFLYNIQLFQYHIGFSCIFYTFQDQNH